ncbi:MAG: hypothetical protein IJA99_02425 [Oscillospiraceae bacterium]|nr:hypothetical protein [Oscillospiraceae bacterium]
MAEKKFTVAQGIQIPVVSGVENGYEMERNEDGLWQFTVVLSAEKITALLKDYCEMLPSPGYFTLELPVPDSDAFDIWYVDGCTRLVLKAIVERYGDLLCADGFVRFGFASHDTPEQIYVTDLKTIQIYGRKAEKICALLKKHEIPAKDHVVKLWDILSDENPCELIPAEVDEESVFDLPQLLEEAGIYLAGRREE